MKGITIRGEGGWGWGWGWGGGGGGGGGRDGDLTGVYPSQRPLFEPRLFSQGYSFLLKSLAKGIFLTKIQDEK